MQAFRLQSDEALVIRSGIQSLKFSKALGSYKKIKHWSLHSLLVKLIKIGVKIARHSRYVTFQMAEVAIDKRLFAKILSRIERLRCCAG